MINVQHFSLGAILIGATFASLFSLSFFLPFRRKIEMRAVKIFNRAPQHISILLLILVFRDDVYRKKCDLFPSIPLQTFPMNLTIYSDWEGKINVTLLPFDEVQKVISHNGTVHYLKVR